MIKMYEDELNSLKEKMQAAEAFAEKIPCFADKILKNKYSQEDENLDFGGWYKKLYLRFEMYRSIYSKTNVPTNFKGEYSGPLFKIYVNSYTLFNLHENFDLYEKTGDCKIFFIDKLNSTFYVEDEGIENFLDTLEKWYLESLPLVKESINKKKREQLLKELENLT